MYFRDDENQTKPKQKHKSKELKKFLLINYLMSHIFARTRHNSYERNTLNSFISYYRDIYWQNPNT